MIRNVFVFGDSIAYGCWDELGGWANRLSKYFNDDSKYYYNLSIPGNTTEDLLKRFENEIRARTDDNESNIIIFAIGINDSKYDKKESFQKNIEKLFSLAMKYSSKIFFVGFTPVDEKKAEAYFGDGQFKNIIISEYDDIARMLCKKKLVEFISVYNTLIADSEKWTDGLHPGSRSHKKIFEIVKKELEKEKIILELA